MEVWEILFTMILLGKREYLTEPGCIRKWEQMCSCGDSGCDGLGSTWLRRKFIGCPMRWSSTLQVHPFHPVTLLGFGCESGCSYYVIAKHGPVYFSACDSASERWEELVGVVSSRPLKVTNQQKKSKNSTVNTIWPSPGLPANISGS